MIENVPRVLPQGLKVAFDFSWEVPPVFRVIQELGRIAESEMYRVFNMGVGMAVVVEADDVHKVMELCSEAGLAHLW